MSNTSEEGCRWMNLWRKVIGYEYRMVPKAPGILVIWGTHVVWGAIPGIQAFLYAAVVNALIHGNGLPLASRLRPLWWLVASQLTVYVLRWIYEIVHEGVHLEVTRHTLEDIWEAVLRAPTLAFQHDRYKQQLSRVLTYRRAPFVFVDGVKLLLQATVTVGVFAVFMWTVNPVVGVGFLLAMALYAAVLYFQSAVEHALRVQQTPAQMQLDHLATVLTDKTYAGELRVYRYARYLRERWRELHATIGRAYLRIRRRHLGLDLTASTVGLVLFGGILLVMVEAIARGTAAPGSLAGLTTFIISMSSYLQSFGWQTRYLAQAVQETGEIVRFVATHVAESSTSAALDSATFLPPADIVLEEVNFRYPDQAQDALTGITLAIPSGKTVALVGENGSGKTTLAALVAGLYPVDRGRVRWANFDYATMPQSLLRRQFAMVFQTPVRYDLSLADNILLGRSPDTAYSEVYRRLRLDELAARLNLSPSEPLGRRFGTRELSGGWWQRVAMARALLYNAPVFILDEPTAALDPIAETALLTDFIHLMEGRTAIVITHRLGIVPHCDVAIVLEQGTVREQGTHSELLRRNSVYARLWRTQAAWYKEGAAPS